VLAGGFSLALMAPALAAGTALDGTAILADPSLANGPVLPASTATAGVAAVSAAQDGPLTNCSRRNPCAMATPARDQVTVSADNAAVGRHPNMNAAQAAKPHPLSGSAADLRS
jgi:hypothetical protein